MANRDELVQAAANGDLGAREKIFELVKPIVVGKLRASFRGITKDELDDIFQQAAVRATENLERLRSLVWSSWQAWFTSIGFTTAADYWRQKRAMKGDGTPVETASSIVDPHTTPRTKLARSEARSAFLDRFHEVYENLSTKDQFLLCRRMKGNATWPELAEELGESEDALRKRYQRLRERLKKLIGGGFEDLL